MSIIDTTTDMRRKKLALLEQSRRRYIQMLYGYLPCLSMPDDAGVAYIAIDVMKHIAELHECILIGSKPKTHAEAAPSDVPEEYEAFVEPLTTEEEDELRVLIGKYHIYVARDPDTQEMTMTHPFISGAFHPLSEREVLEVARDIASKAGGAV